MGRWHAKPAHELNHSKKKEFVLSKLATAKGKAPAYFLSLLPEDFARAALVDIALALPVRTADVNIVNFVVGHVGLRVDSDAPGLDLEAVKVVALENRVVYSRLGILIAQQHP